MDTLSPSTIRALTPHKGKTINVFVYSNAPTYVASVRARYAAHGFKTRIICGAREIKEPTGEK